jgi:beta-lactamase regulating signal transducer with metallopeptidase domain
MKHFAEWFSSVWAESLGWALLHSLWQSFVVLAVITVLFRFVSGRNAMLRYLIATGGLLLVLITAVCTFVYLLLSTQTHSAGEVAKFSHALHAEQTTAADAGLLEQLISSIESNIHLMTACWMIGTFFFALRLAGSWWYVSSLKTQSTEINGYWREQLLTMARQFGIQFTPTLAESARITAPVVIGYLKPVILLPVGMISGLSSEQIEAILLHELTHIKRHDYLINILQSLIETLLFFNPFVWMISSIIRREREHCCDDAVILHSNPKTYAFALAQLEEIRLHRSGLALSLAENKNQLLNRIKRIMEKSVKNYSSREKMIPVLLLITGLICASWISLQSQEPAKNETRVVPADTTKKKNKSATFKYKSVTTIGPDGKPKEEIVQYFGGDDEIRPLFAIPPVPDVDFILPPDFDALAPPPDFDFSMAPVPHMGMNAEEWEAFGKEFEAKFKEQFGDFYEKHQEDFEKMMHELETSFQERFDEQWSEELTEAIEAKEEALQHHAEAVAAKAEAMAHQEEMIEHMSEWQQEHAAEMKALEANMKKMEENMRRFEKELRDELIKDGYLKKDEKIGNIHWKMDGKIEINDTEIKEADLPKYHALHRKYFKEMEGEFNYVD